MFDHAANLWSPGNLKKFCLLLTKPWQDGGFRDKVQNVNDFKRFKIKTFKQPSTSSGHCFFSTSFVTVFQKQTGKGLVVNVLSFITQGVCGQDLACIIDHTGKCFCRVPFIVKLCVCQHNVMCFRHSHGGFKRKHVGSLLVNH